MKQLFISVILLFVVGFIAYTFFPEATPSVASDSFKKEVSTHAKNTYEQAKSVASTAKEKASDATSSMRSKAKSAMNSVEETTGKTIDSVKKGAHSAATSIKKAANATAEYADDAILTTTIKGKYVAEKNLNSFDISVETADGIVTLSGTVENLAQKKLAEKIASETKGVNEVKNMLIPKN